jgi:hypothetical protein
MQQLQDFLADYMIVGLLPLMLLGRLKIAQTVTLKMRYK